MKSVLISIHPEWCEKICHEIGKYETGKPIYEKRIEVRKSAPKEVPFKAYIYCTKTKSKWRYSAYVGAYVNSKDEIVYAQQHIIGEFVCDKVEMVNAKCSDYGIDLFYHDCLTNGCLTEREIEKYFNIPEDKDLRAMKGNGYAWHISDLKIYDKPKELSEFYSPCPIENKDCENCIRYGKPHKWDFDEKQGLIYCTRRLSRPPQSWQYVEEVKI